MSRVLHRRPAPFLILIVVSAARAAPPAPTTSPALRTYPVERLICDFPHRDDSSTPESAYATVRRHDLDTTDPPGVGQILEVFTFGQEAAVHARRADGRIDVAFFHLQDGQWLGAEIGEALTLPLARRLTLRRFSASVPQPPRDKIADPAAYLQPLVDHLRRTARPPRDFLLQSLAAHRLTVIGEIHHRPAYWSLNSRLVADPSFARTTGTIYLELPSNHQSDIDRFLAAGAFDPVPVIHTFRDVSWMGWPDQPMLDFFDTVWKVNQVLPANRRIRVVAVDTPRPWKDIHRRDDWKRYETDRDHYMAGKILADLPRRSDPRGALFVVGYAHAARALRFSADQLSVIDTAASQLAESLGDQLYTILQHGPVIDNLGGTYGRAARGLFDSAFAAYTPGGSQPIAFPLADSPFGAQPFDVEAELARVTTGRYQDAFDAYLYLGPLEDEIFSPLIQDFYTDDFVNELDRRSRLSSGRALAADLHLPAADGRTFAGWMSNTWGRPRGWRDRLGPLDAWQAGDDGRRAIPQHAATQPAPPPDQLFAPEDHQ
jgi:hypothetical protein